MFDPVYAEITASAALDAATDESMTVNSSLSESTPEPLSAVAASAAMTAAKLSAFTPLMPIAASASGVSAGDAFPPAAVSKMPATVAASAASSACVSTADDESLSIMSLSSDAFAAVSILVKPSVTYCDTDSETSLSSVPSAPISAPV